MNLSTEYFLNIQRRLESIDTALWILIVQGLIVIALLIALVAR